ncbi:MAG: response regulator transcription factor [Saprospiraceae bacterium]
MVRIAIVEDDVFLLQTLNLVLNKNEQLDVVGLFNNSEKALLDIPVLMPDIVLMDLNLGSQSLSGIDCITRLKPTNPTILFLILTVSEDHEKVFDALAAGALGYILKSTSKENIIDAILDLASGGSPMTPSIARKVALSFAHKPEFNLPQGDTNMLTLREKEVIELISKGKLEKEVASELFISYKTVKVHISNIYAKLHVNTRVSALNKYFNR